MKKCNDEFTIFLHIYVYIDGFLNFWGCFFLWKAYQTLSRARTFQLVSQQSLASINNKNFNILTRRPTVATTFPPGTKRHHWGIGIPGFAFGSSIKARAIPPPFLGSALPWLQAVCRVSIGRHQHQLYRKGAYINYLWLCSESTDKKGVLFDQRKFSSTNGNDEFTISLHFYVYLMAS